MSYNILNMGGRLIKTVNRIRGRELVFFIMETTTRED